MVADASPPTETPKKPKKKRINYALGAVLVSKGFDYDAAAQQAGAKNGRVLRVGLRRKGITATASRALLPSLPERVSVTAKIVSDVQDALRDKLNSGLDAQASKLLAKKPGKLHNRGQGDASVLETLSRTWRNLNGNPDSITVQFGVGMDREKLIAGPKAQAVVEVSEVQQSANPTGSGEVQDSQ